MTPAHEQMSEMALAPIPSWLTPTLMAMLLWGVARVGQEVYRRGATGFFFFSAVSYAFANATGIWLFGVPEIPPPFARESGIRGTRTPPTLDASLDRTTSNRQRPDVDRGAAVAAYRRSP